MDDNHKCIKSFSFLQTNDEVVVDMTASENVGDTVQQPYQADTMPDNEICRVDLPNAEAPVLGVSDPGEYF